MMSASKTLKKNLSIAVTAVFLAVTAFACWAIEPSKVYADTTGSHLTVASEVHVLVDSEGNVTIPNATVTNDGTCAAYIMGCSSPDGLGWTCDAVGKRIEVGQSITATWRSAGPVSDEIAAQLGEEPYYAGNLTYTYTDGDLKGTVSLDNTDPTVGDTITATVTGANVPDDKLTYQWVKVKDGSETSIDGASGSTYTATDDDAGYELVCKVISTDDICQGTISGATGAVKKIQAFAVYSADDGSLNFYRRAIAELPSAGEQFEGKPTTAVYTGIEDTKGSQPWSEYMSDIKTATVVDSGIQPKNTAFWFSRCANMTQFDASKLDVSQTTNMMLMFSGCSSLTDLSSLAGWDTSQVTDMGNMFSSLSHITDLSSISGWNTSSVTNMGGMLAGLTTPIALDLSNWDTSQVTDMGNMFSSSSGISTIGDLSNWDTSNVTNADSMFFGCSSLTSLALSGWDTSKVSDMDNMFDFCNNLQLVMLGDKWQWVGTKGYLPTPDPQYITGADGKWYDADGNGYTPADIPSNKAMTYTAVAPKTAFAVYSADDQSLNFYKRSGIPAAGEQFEGKTATAVYTGIETGNYSSDPVPWDNFLTNITSSQVVDEGIAPVSTSNWFDGCSSLTSVDLSKLDMSNVEEMAAMFKYCESLTTVGDLSNWDTSNVTDMSFLFFNCPSLTTVGDLSNWDTSNVEEMIYAFGDCRSLKTLELSSWDTSNVADMEYMFDGCSKLKKIALGADWKWVGTEGCPEAPSNSYIEGADGKWYDTDGNGYAPADIPSNKAMTYYASKDLLPKAFAVYSDDDQSLSFYKRSAVPAAGEQFNGKTATAVYTGIETDRYGVVSQPWSGYVSKIKTATVVDAGLQPKSTAFWFANCKSITQCDMSKLDTSSLTDASGMFFGCSSITTLDLSAWDTSKVTTMSGMFSYCTSLTTLDLSGWDVSNLTDASDMFRASSSLATIGDLYSWDTSKVTTMNGMFAGCSSITTLCVISGWDVSNLTDASAMFSRCTSLSPLDLSGWDTSKVTDMSGMFSGCFRLSVNCSNWDVSKVARKDSFKTEAPGVILPLAWQTSSDEGVKDSAIAPLCEEQGNGDALSVPSENGNDEATSKTDGKASADSEAEGSTTASADDVGAKEEEASGDIVQEETAAA